MVTIAFLATVGALGQQIREVRDVQGEFITATDVILLGALMLPSVAVFVFPITYMIGVLLAFGRLAHTNEITAMRAAGISLARLLRPVAVGGIALAGFCYFITDSVQPWAMTQIYRLVYQEMPVRITLDALTPGVMHQFGDWRVYFRSKDREQRILRDVDILVPEKDGPGMMYFAESAQVIHNGTGWQIELKNSNVIYPTAGGSVGLIDFSGTMPIPNLEPQKARANRDRLTLRQLFELDQLTQLARELGSGWNSKLIGEITAAKGVIADVPSIPASVKVKYPITVTVDPNALAALSEGGAGRFGDSMRETRSEASKRIAMPIACLAVPLLAAALAIRGQQGSRGVSYGIGVAMVLCYYTLMLLTEPHSLHDMDEMILRAMVPNILFLSAGIFMMWRVDRV